MQTRKFVPHLWLALSILMVLALVLTACSSPTTEAPITEPTTAPTTAPTAEPTKEPTAVPTPEPTPLPAVTTLIQDFETNAQPYDGGQAKASLGDVAYNGAASLKSESDTGEWHTVGVNLGDGPVDISGFGRLCYFVYDTTANNNGKAANTVGVKLIDAAGASVERYTDNEGVGANVKTKTDQWVPMCMNIVSFTGIDQTKVEKIEFTMYWAGVYYFDDITLLAQNDKLVVKEPPAGPTSTILLQGFEADGTYYADYQVTPTLTTTVVHGGSSSLLASGPSGEWHAFGAYPDVRPVDLSKATKICFWINDTTANNDGQAGNTVGVKIFDATGANEEVWTDHSLAGENPKTVKDQWVQMCMNTEAFSRVDMAQIDKIQFALYWAGNYFVDDIEAVLTTGAPTVLAQGFEEEGSYYADYQVTPTLTTTVVHSGKYSLLASGPSGDWHAFGAFPSTRPFDASKHSKICYYIYDTTANNDGKADNTVGVKLFDESGANAEVWTDNPLAGENSKTVKDQWVQHCVNLDAFTTIDLAKIDKIQFALFWAGNYFVDDIRFIGSSGPAPVLVQGFEAEGTFYNDYQVTTTLTTTVVHSGKSSLLASGPSGEWHAFGAYPDTRPYDASKATKICYWIYDTTAFNDGQANNSVGVKLFDASGANSEIWSDHELAGQNLKTVKNQWVQQCINLDAYSGIDLSQIDKIQFALYWAGNYFVDDIKFYSDAATPVPQMIQGFEAEDTYYADYQVTPTLTTTLVHGGASSLLAFGPKGDWHAFGAYPNEVPFDASGASKICFWIYDTTANNNGLADNTIGVKVFDSAGANEEVWTDNPLAGENSKTVQNQWVQMCINTSAFLTVDVSKIEKIQFALFWAGTYFVDDIKAVP